MNLFKITNTHTLETSQILKILPPPPPNKNTPKVHETTKCMTDLELSVYDSWFNPFINQNPSLVPDGFIYLRAEPETCMDRMKVRDR